MRSQTLVIADRGALQALPGRLFGARPQRLQLALPGLDEPARAEAESRLARGLSACGCNEGAIALLAALPAAIALVLVLEPGASRWLAAGGVLVTAGALGKVVGLLRARAALQREVKRVLARLPEAQLTGQPPASRASHGPAPAGSGTAAPARSPGR